MRVIHWFAMAAVLAPTPLAAQALPAVRAQASVPAARPRTAAVQALFDGYVRDRRMPGIVGAFGTGDAPPVFVSAGRIADDPRAGRAGPDTLWRIYSMTKPVTAMAAMMLVEEGKMGLDQPLSNFVPRFAGVRVLARPDAGLESRPAVRPITIRHLLTHTSGLGYTIVTKGPLLKEYERLGLVPFQVEARTEALARAARPTSLKDFAERAATAPLIADPGTRWSYSIGLDVLARAVEVAAGVPFERFLATRLFVPLGMTSTFFTVPAGEAGRLATSYAYLGARGVPFDPGAASVWLRPPSFPYGGAGLVSSARDYDRFLRMIQNGGALDGRRVLKPETVRLATSNLLPPGVRFTGGGAGGYGAGGYVVTAGPARGTYGWSGAAGTLAWVNPLAGTRATVMVNYFPPERVPLRRDVSAALGAGL